MDLDGVGEGGSSRNAIVIDGPVPVPGPSSSSSSSVVINSGVKMEMESGISVVVPSAAEDDVEGSASLGRTEKNKRRKVAERLFSTLDAVLVKCQLIGDADFFEGAEGFGFGEGGGAEMVVVPPPVPDEEELDNENGEDALKKDETGVEEKVPGDQDETDAAKNAEAKSDDGDVVMKDADAKNTDDTIEEVAEEEQNEEGGDSPSEEPEKGRPRKNSDDPVKEKKKKEEGDAPEKKRGRGRPRKNPDEVKEVKKKGKRGRKPKYPNPAEGKDASMLGRRGRIPTPKEIAEREAKAKAEAEAAAKAKAEAEAEAKAKAKAKAEEEARKKAEAALSQKSKKSLSRKSLHISGQRKLVARTWAAHRAQHEYVKNKYIAMLRSAMHQFKKRIADEKDPTKNMRKKKRTAAPDEGKEDELQTIGTGKASEEEVALLREEAYNEAKLLVKGVKLPLEIGGSMRLESFGEIIYEIDGLLSTAYHTSRHIYPVGYRLSRRYPCVENPKNRVMYTSIVEYGGPEGPKFRVEHESGRHKWEGVKTTSVWLQILKALNEKRRSLGMQFRDKLTISGTEAFGIAHNTVGAYLEGLPNAEKLKRYKFRSQRMGSKRGVVMYTEASKKSKNKSQVRGNGKGGGAQEGAGPFLPREKMLKKFEDKLATLRLIEALLTSEPATKGDTSALEKAQSELANAEQECLKIFHGGGERGRGRHAHLKASKRGRDTLLDRTKELRSVLGEYKKRKAGALGL